MNNAGEVAGPAERVDGAVHAFFWKSGVKTDLGTVAGDTCSEVHDMNASGQAVGTSGDCAGDPSTNGFLWQRGVGLIDLNAFVPPGSDLTNDGRRDDQRSRRDRRNRQVAERRLPRRGSAPLQRPWDGMPVNRFDEGRSVSGSGTRP